MRTTNHLSCIPLYTILSRHHLPPQYPSSYRATTIHFCLTQLFTSFCFFLRSEIMMNDIALELFVLGIRWNFTNKTVFCMQKPYIFQVSFLFSVNKYPATLWVNSWLTIIFNELLNKKKREKKTNTFSKKPINFAWWQRGRLRKKLPRSIWIMKPFWCNET